MSIDLLLCNFFMSLSDSDQTSPASGSKPEFGWQRQMTVKKARELWGQGHRQLTDKQLQDIIDLMYFVSIGVYEKRINL
ncbi:hypothetical protein [Acanthopleuribacter pedis]|uniref:Uncharacterized protein n=1 Tax=Acanthopleuribacter pedis TaxID=442870 RepID=A0A8J7Q313_9BACT|nr:hypothetical protein [Acanthopleuribacter pedis]MBO1318315.1 hypothetical protein [Acanthopleuribacter pedis]